MLDKFIDGDIEKVDEIKNYLIKTEDDDYFAFYPAEYWFILYWTKDYIELAESIQKFDSIKVASFNTRIPPQSDMLYNKLKEKTFKNETNIKGQIENSEIDKETKQILTLNLDWLLLKNRESIYARDTLNIQADSFLETYTKSDYADFIKNHIRFKQVPRNWGTAYNLFTGYGIFTGNLSDNFKHNVPVGIAFDICFKNFELYLRNNFGFNKTKKDFDYSLGTFEKGSRTMVFLPEASLGYVTYNENRFKVTPFAGIGATDISPILDEGEEIPELEEVELEFTTTYMLGINFDIKFGAKKTPAYSPKTSYGFIRIRYAYNILRFDKKNDGMTGNMHYVTIGFGGMERGSQREH